VAKISSAFSVMLLFFSGCSIDTAESSMCCSAFGVPGIVASGVLLKRDFLPIVSFRGARRLSLLAAAQSLKDRPDCMLPSLPDEHEESASDDPASVVSSSMNVPFLR
jgi:hypothetical protein